MKLTKEQINQYLSLADATLEQEGQRMDFIRIKFNKSGLRQKLKADRVLAYIAHKTGQPVAEPVIKPKLNFVKKQPNQKISISLDADLIEKIKLIAMANNTKISKVISEFLKQSL